MEFSIKSFEFTRATGGYLFDARQPEGHDELHELLLTFRSALQGFASMPQSSVGSLHTLLVDSLGLVEAIGQSRFTAKERAEFAQKCREHHDYLMWKCKEQTASLPSSWHEGVTFNPDTTDARGTILAVVGETLAHLGSYLAHNQVYDKRRPIADEAKFDYTDDRPIAFAPSVDDTGKWRRYMYVGKETALVETHGGFSLFLDLRDLSLTPTLLQTGWRQPSTEQLLRSLLAPGMSYVNAGANVGYFACLGAKLVQQQGKVFVFEANPDAVALLKRSVHYNNLASRVRLIEAAVSDRAGVERFFFVPEQLGGGTLYEPAAPASNPGTTPDDYGLLVYARKDYKTVHVRTVTLDETVGRRIKAVDVLHMDVEGAEGPAILGAKDMIARSPGLRILMKWSVGTRTDATLRELHKNAADLLIRNNFKFYQIAAPKGNAFKVPPDLIKVDPQDLLHLFDAPLLATRS